ncbi:MAG: hypothetical protein HYZ08_02620 [Candidatus Kerfeldbacteria bacterium]|nr:hypothetical protein [Candidatus Kerfeldbacteria bacterium]
MPKLITFSGIDGSGKTTQCGMLSDALRNRGQSVFSGHANRPLLRHDTKGSRASTLPRWLRWFPVFLFIVIKDLLKIWLTSIQARQFDVWISDRYVDDLIVKLRHYGMRSASLESLVFSCTPTPLFRFWMTIPVEVSWSRDHEYSREFHQTKAALYLEWFDSPRCRNVVRLDGTQTPEEIHNLVMQRLEHVLQ